MKTDRVGCRSSCCSLLSACGGASRSAASARVDARRRCRPAWPRRRPPATERGRPQPRRAKSDRPEVDRAIAAIKANDFTQRQGRARAGARTRTRRTAPRRTTWASRSRTSATSRAPSSATRTRSSNAPDLAEAAVNLGALYLDQSQWDDAIAVTQKGARQALRRSRAARQHGRGAARQGRQGRRCGRVRASGQGRGRQRRAPLRLRRASSRDGQQAEGRRPSSRALSRRPAPTARSWPPSGGCSARPARSPTASPRSTRQSPPGTTPSCASGADSAATR